MRILISVMLLVLLSACAQQGPVKLYAGADRPASELVTLRVPADMEIQSINGGKVAGAGGLGRNEYQNL